MTLTLTTTSELSVCCSGRGLFLVPATLALAETSRLSVWSSGGELLLVSDTLALAVTLSSVDRVPLFCCLLLRSFDFLLDLAGSALAVTSPGSGCVLPLLDLAVTLAPLAGSSPTAGIILLALATWALAFADGSLSLRSSSSIAG